MRYYFILSVIMFIGTYQSYGQQQEGSSSDEIVARRFDHNHWKEVVGSTDYSEDKTTTKQNSKGNSFPSESSNTRTDQNGDGNVNDSPINVGPMGGLVLNVVAWALIIGVVGYIIFLVLNNIAITRNIKTAKSILPIYSAPVENIRELEIDRLLREALASGNYRLAVRIYFLGMLKQLDQAGFILWKKDKTNRDYLSELFLRADYFEEVKKLTLVYEQVWYGEHDLSLHSYEEIIGSFKAIDQKLQQSSMPS